VRRAAERDQAAIDRWVKDDWPRIRQCPTTQSLAGRVRRARVQPDPQGAPQLGPTRGRPPVLVSVQLEKVSMVAALCYGVRGGGAQLAFHVTAGSYDTTPLAEVIDQADQGIQRVRSTPQLADSFLRQAGLSVA
jgi:hypothetical protein